MIPVYFMFMCMFQKGSCKTIFWSVSENTVKEKNTFNFYQINIGRLLTVYSS